MFPLPEPISFDAGMGIQTITSLREAAAALNRLPRDVLRKPTFAHAEALVAEAIRWSDDQAIASATEALKAALVSEGMYRRF